MKVYMTKYALTNGIELIEVEMSGVAPGMVTERTNGYPRHFHGEGKDWHRTWEGALDRANKMRSNKIVSLRKSIAKMEKLTFDPPPQ